jgi:hypothetical protein
VQVSADLNFVKLSNGDQKRIAVHQKTIELTLEAGISIAGVLKNDRIHWKNGDTWKRQAPEAQAWCCEAQGVGCDPREPAANTSTVTTTRTTTTRNMLPPSTPPSTTTVHYDCMTERHSKHSGFAGVWYNGTAKYEISADLTVVRLSNGIRKHIKVDKVNIELRLDAGVVIGGLLLHGHIRWENGDAWARKAPGEQLFCCRAYGVDCPEEATTTAATTITETTTTTLPYDCIADWSKQGFAGLWYNGTVRIHISAALTDVKLSNGVRKHIEVHGKKIVLTLEQGVSLTGFLGHGRIVWATAGGTAWKRQAPGEEEWCCKVQNIGCASEVSAEEDPPTATGAAHSRFDCDEPRYTAGKPLRTAVHAGVRVQRGPDWKWEDQDGGSGTTGKTTGEESKVGWVKVRWPSREGSHDYRVGAEGAYDLVVTNQIAYDAWSPRKRAWCCEQEGAGCVSGGGAPAAAARAAFDAAREAPDSSMVHAGSVLTYDCEAGRQHWQNEWTVAKSVWCCDHHQGVACDVPTTTMAVLFYDCQAGYRPRWQPKKQAWCCRSEGIGCLP